MLGKIENENVQFTLCDKVPHKIITLTQSPLMLSSCSKDDLTSLILECDELVLTYVWKAVTPKSG